MANTKVHHSSNGHRNFFPLMAFKWMYDANSLKKLLIDAGFSDVTNPACHQGRLARLLEIENPSRVEGGAGVIAEGIKP